MADTSPSKSFKEKIFGKKAKDVELPNKSGKYDKRLSGSMKAGLSIFKDLGKAKK